MQRNNRAYKSVLVGVALALLIGASFFQGHLNRQRDALGLTRVTALENAPPLLAFTTVALGGFRGLIANALWIRASDLQENDKFFEMVQLADWITKLQPHFTTVWVHQAWNMTYNISIKFNDMEERWMWVLRGLELLRDEGMKYNPKEPLMYRELAWFFQHKIGQNLDDGHEYYKRVWAQEMNEVLLTVPPNFEELLDPKTPEAQARVAKLRGKYKMDPKWMREVEERYGPLEWRLPETHSIYWGYVGLQVCRDGKEEELVQLRRNIFQSMQLAFHRGRLIFPRKGVFEFQYGPNIEIIGKVNAAYEEMIEREPNMKDNLRNAHKNFLKTAVYFLYTYNRIKSADGWFNYLYEHYPDSLLTYQQQEQKLKDPTIRFPRKSLDEYALERVSEEIGDGGVDRVKAVVEGYITSAFLSLAMSDDDRAAGLDRYARLIWVKYMERIAGQAEKRVALPPLEQMKREVLNTLLDPEEGLEPTMANQLRTALGLPAGEVADPKAAGPASSAPSTTTPTTAPAGAGATTAPGKP